MDRHVLLFPWLVLPWNSFFEPGADVRLWMFPFRISHAGRNFGMSTRYSVDFKVHVAFEACKEDRTLAQLSREFGVSPEQICRWKKKLQSNAVLVFTGKQMKKNREEPSAVLYEEIGAPKMELDRMKKSS